MDTNGDEILLQEAMEQNTISDKTLDNTTEAESDYSSESSLEDNDDVTNDPQEILDKAGCATLLSNLQLNPDGTVPIELLLECVQCLCANKLWPALILCKAISVLKPDHELADNLLQVIAVKIKQNMQESGSSDDSESSDTDSSECSSNSESESESSDTEDDTVTSNKTEEQKKSAKHSCSACTNQLTN